MPARPQAHTGLHHVALHVKNFTACGHFYIELLGMEVMWQPDENNLYLTSGNDNLALHRAPDDIVFQDQQHLDHIGFFLTERKAVDEWHTFLAEKNVKIKAAPKDHRDGTRSFYCEDPDGNVIQMIYYPIENNKNINVT